MPGLIIKCSFLEKSAPAEGYLHYIATRDGVEKPENEPDRKLFVSGQRYMEYMALRPGAERHGEHGLFGPGKTVSLDTACAELNAREGTAWILICSLHRSDATRLGYDNAAAWKYLLEANQTRIAEALHIPLGQLQWYAAFHNEGHHPHIHLIAWAREGAVGKLAVEGIRKLRSTLTNTIFQDELWHLYEKKDLAYRALVQKARKAMEQAIADMEQSAAWDPNVDMKMAALAERLKSVPGKKQYGYLPKALKQQVDEIVDLLARHPAVAAYYAAWNELRDELEKYYHDQPREWKSLSQQKEFRAIRNMVIREAVHMESRIEQKEPEQMDDNEQKSEVGLSNMICLLRQITAVFRENICPPANPAGIRVESKRRKKLIEKRIAQGHKLDDHEAYGQRMA